MLNPCRTVALSSQENICVREFTEGGGPNFIPGTNTLDTTDVTRCIGVNDAECTCNSLASLLPDARDREGCTANTTTNSTGFTSTEVICLSYSDFRSQCEDLTSCPDTNFNSLLNAIIIYSLVFGIFLVPTFLGACGMLTFKSWHPNEFFGDFTSCQYVSRVF